VASEPPAPPISARRLLVLLGGTLGILLAVFMAWGPGSRGAEPDGTPAEASAARAAQADARYAPQELSVARGRNEGELIVTWRMPIRPDVLATVIYEGTGPAQPRAVVNYSSSSQSVPQATLRGLPKGQRVCLSAAHVVSIDDTVTNAVSRPVCAAPR
jgi:hypothetical protein